MNETRPDIGFTATLGVAGGRLTIDYAVDNRTQSTLYVFDRIALFRERGIVEVEPDQAWVFLQSPGTVRIVRALMPNPSLKNIAKRPPNLASRVAARTTHKGTVRLALPLAERHPFYVDLDPQGAVPVDVRTVRFQVGVAEERSGMEVSEYPTRGGPEIQVAGGWGKPVQWQLEQAFEVNGVAVLQHPLPFERPPILQ